MDHDRRWRVAERYHVLFLRTSFLDLVLVCGGRLSADFESHFSQNIFVAYSRNPVKSRANLRAADRHAANNALLKKRINARLRRGVT